MITIIQKDNPILREIAKPLPDNMFDSNELKQIISNMAKASEAEDDAVAIAAPQIAIGYRIFYITNRAKEVLKSSDLPQIYINPKIIKSSKDKKAMDEGCLSVRWLYGSVRRASRVTIEACDEQGNKFTRGASGLLAQIYQHEIDHLDGILFIDKAKDVKELPQEEIQKIKSQNNKKI